VKQVEILALPLQDAVDLGSEVDDGGGGGDGDDGVCETTSLDHADRHSMLEHSPDLQSLH